MTPDARSKQKQKKPTGSSGYGSMFENVREKKPKAVGSGGVGVDPQQALAQQQAVALENAGQQEMAGLMPAPALAIGYQSGGYEGVVNSVGANDWYNMPEWQRTQQLAALSGSGR